MSPAGRNGRIGGPHQDDVAAIVPCHIAPPKEALLSGVRARVGRVLLVDDGMPRDAAGRLRALAHRCDAAVLHLPRNRGKGAAVAAGIAHLARASDPEAVLVVDSDGQHPPDAAPRFLAAAANADLVIGDRFGDLMRMPVDRRLANIGASLIVSASARRWVRDSQCGMRLLRGRALHEVVFPVGGYESETRHLVACLRAGVEVSWVPIPAVYEGEPSSFRAVRDSMRVLVASRG